METSNASDDALDESPDVLVTAPPSPRAPSADSIIHLPSLMQQISTNLPPVHHDLQRTTTQPISTTVITNESTNFALSRFPFPPFTIRFNSNNISPSFIIEDLKKFCQQNHHTTLEILHCRLARSDSIQQRDYLLYVKNATSFCFLLETNNWPNTIKNLTFSLPLIPRIPPQLSLIIKDVDLNIDFDEFCSDIKSQYPDIKNVVRLKNKFDKHIKLIKIELTSLNTREKLLNDKRILINYIYYSIDEYLAPFQVLICSKCAGIGHFRNTCLQIKTTCKTCCELIDDPNQHHCSNIIKCAHCGSNHKSTSASCPIIKAYRAELTKKILQTNKTQSITNNNSSNSLSPFNWFNRNQQTVQSTANNDMINKLNDLINKISDIKTGLENLSSKYENFTRFMIEKEQSDQILKQNFNFVADTTKNLSIDCSSLKSKITRQESISEQLLIPMLSDIIQMIIPQMSNLVDAEFHSSFKQNLDQYLKQIQQIRDGKYSVS